MQRAPNNGIIAAGRRVVANRFLNAVSIGLPLAGVSLGVISSGHAARPTTATWLVFAASSGVTAFGIGVGLHRYFTHHAFETTRAFRLVLAIVGTGALQGPIDRWVADHRRHHRFTDQPLDPHSPYWRGGQPIHSRVRGLIHAHLLWMLVGDVSDEQQYASDIVRDPISRACSRAYWPLCALSLGAPAAIGWWLGGAHELLRCFIWAGCARVILLQQITWSVNSIGHMFGSRAGGSADRSCDNRVLAVLLLGEGLHNYHHRFPNAALNRPAWLDANGLLICGLQKLGIVWSLRVGIKEDLEIGSRPR